MIPCRKAGFAGFTDNLFLLDLLANFRIDGAQMRIERKQAQPVIDDYRVSVDSQVADEGDDPAIGRFRGRMFRNR